MKRILLATVALAALGSASALAADLPQRPVYKAEPVMMAPPPTWTGCYVGGNIGGAFGDASVSTAGGASLWKRFWLCRWRSDRLRLPIQRRICDRRPQYV